jgi:hypothetical protein
MHAPGSSRFGPFASHGDATKTARHFSAGTIGPDKERTSSGATTDLNSNATPDLDHFFRIVEVWDEEKQRSFTFLSKIFALLDPTRQQC